MSSDGELLERSGDDPDAFAELYRRHCTAVTAYFVRRTGCAQTAADLAAETFAQAFSSRRRFVDTGAPGAAWLFTIAQRQLSRYQRRQTVSDRARRRLGIAPIELDAADLQRVEDLIDIAGFADDLRAAVNDLPDAQRRAVHLRVNLGLPFAEVAAQLGCSEGAARVRVSRALASLARTLDPEGMR